MAKEHEEVTKVGEEGETLVCSVHHVCIVAGISFFLRIEELAPFVVLGQECDVSPPEDVFRGACFSLFFLARLI